MPAWKEHVVNQKQDIWSLVTEEFSEKIPRRTAIVVKQDDWGLPFAYPADFGKIGYLLDSRNTSGYKEDPVLCTSFAEYGYSGSLYGFEKSPFYFGRMQYSPSVIRREVKFSNMGIIADETFCQSPGGGFVWDLDCRCVNHPNSPFDRRIFTIFTMIDAGSTLRTYDGHVEIEYQSDHVCDPAHGTKDVLHIYTDFEKVAAYTSIDNFLQEAESGEVSGDGAGRYIVFQHHLEILPQNRKTIRFGMDFGDEGKARKSFQEDLPVDRIAQGWNSWFSTLPSLPSGDEDALHAYYKCWFVTRLDYYEDARYGKTMIESLPVYRGYWQWALTGHEIASSMNEELGGQYISDLIDLFLKYQREDGYVTHAIYLDEEVPGSGWAAENIVQTPHIPWIALRYFNRTGDLAAIERWYPALKKYYEYLCESRDRHFKNLHLWAVLTSYDTGLDTTSVFDRVTHGENGVKEEYCYPAIFAAERARYEQAMSRMAALLNNGEADFWAEESAVTVRALNEHLWDDGKKWYGAIHEDGTLDTRVGVDGLFPLAYKLVDADRAQAVRPNLEKLIAKYGVHTVAPDEPGFYGRIYWRGPVWPKAISMAAGSAMNYYPDLAESIRSAAINFALKYPSIWECMDPRDGEIARGDVGVIATPLISTNVGAAELLGALLQLDGVRMLDF